MHISKDLIKIGEKEYNIDFILLPSFKEGLVRAYTWTRFYKRVDWDLDFPLPENFFTLKLGNHGMHYYQQCTPFLLEKDEVNEWLQWEVLSPSEGDDIKALAVITINPIKPEDRKTSIGTTVNFPLWAAQLSMEGMPTIQMHPTPSKELIKATENAIEKGILNIVKSVESKIRNEFSNQSGSSYHGRNFIPNFNNQRKNWDGERSRRPERRNSPERRDRSRSPMRTEAPQLRTLNQQPEPSAPYQPGFMYPNSGQSPMVYHPSQMVGINQPIGSVPLQAQPVIPFNGQSLITPQHQQDSLAQRQRYGN